MSLSKIGSYPDRITELKYLRSYEKHLIKMSRNHILDHSMYDFPWSAFRTLMNAVAVDPTVKNYWKLRPIFQDIFTPWFHPQGLMIDCNNSHYFTVDISGLTTRVSENRDKREFENEFLFDQIQFPNTTLQQIFTTDTFFFIFWYLAMMFKVGQFKVEIYTVSDKFGVPLVDYSVGTQYVADDLSLRLELADSCLFHIHPLSKGDVVPLTIKRKEKVESASTLLAFAVMVNLEFLSINEDCISSFDYLTKRHQVTVIHSDLFSAARLHIYPNYKYLSIGQTAISESERSIGMELLFVSPRGMDKIVLISEHWLFGNNERAFLKDEVDLFLFFDFFDLQTVTRLSVSSFDQQYFSLIGSSFVQMRDGKIIVNLQLNKACLAYVLARGCLIRCSLFTQSLTLIGSTTYTLNF